MQCTPWPRSSQARPSASRRSGSYIGASHQRGIVLCSPPRRLLAMSRKLGMPSTGAGSKSIASRFMRKSAATITRAKWLVAGTPVTVIVCGPTRFFHLRRAARSADRALDARAGGSCCIRCRPSGVGSIEQLMPLRVRRLGDAQRDHQVVEREHGPAARRADDAAQRIDSPAFGRTGQHDVLLLGIDEHVLHALQAGQEAHRIGNRLAGCAWPRRSSTSNCLQRNEPQIGPLFQIGRHFLQALFARRPAAPSARRLPGSRRRRRRRSSRRRPRA